MICWVTISFCLLSSISVTGFLLMWCFLRFDVWISFLELTSWSVTFSVITCSCLQQFLHFKFSTKLTLFSIIVSHTSTSHNANECAISIRISLFLHTKRILGTLAPIFILLFLAIYNSQLDIKLGYQFGINKASSVTNTKSIFGKLEFHFWIFLGNQNISLIVAINNSSG